MFTRSLTNPGTPWGLNAASPAHMQGIGRRVLLQLLLMGVCCCATGLTAVTLGKDIDFDLLNYHYYDVYALLHGRLGWDIAPAQLQTYVNPLFDFPFYFLLTHISNPRWVTFGMGAVQGITAFLLIQLVWTFFQDQPPVRRTIYAAVAIAVGLTGAAGLPVLGTAMVAWEPAGFAVAGILLLLKAQPDTGAMRAATLHGAAGLLVGMAVGGKLTMGPYAVGLAVALLLYRGISFHRIRLVIVFCMAVLLGVAITSGYWFVLLYKHFDNPLFPFFNDIWKSSYWEMVRISIHRFKPRDLTQWLFYPFFWVIKNHLVTELIFRDLRFAVLYIFSILALLYQTFKQNNGMTAFLSPINAPRRLLLIFFLVSYVIWEAMFSIYRYILPLELLSGLILIVLLEHLFVIHFWRIAILLGISGVILVTTIYPDWGRAEFGDKYFPIEVPTLPDDSLLLLAGGAPMAYIVPILDHKVRAVAIKNNLLSPSQGNLLVAKARRIVRDHAGPIFSLSVVRGDGVVNHWYAAYGLKRDLDQCKDLAPRIGDDTLRICPLNRIPVTNGLEK